MEGNYLQTAMIAARAAGQTILNGFKQEHQIQEKENKTIVTEVDKKAEEIIIQILEAESKFPILSEETRNTLPNSDIFWAVDPLDGTTNFSRSIGIFAVSIALVKNKKPILGVIYNPIAKELFSAEFGKGAFLNEERIIVSNDNNIIIPNSGYETSHKEAINNITSKLILNHTVRNLGTTAYELAHVACGKVDGFVALGDALWDHAAGIVLVQEAGGVVTDWKGNDWNIDTDYVLAGNKTSHPELFRITSNL